LRHHGVTPLETRNYYTIFLGKYVVGRIEGKLIFFTVRCDPTWVMASSFLRFSISHTTTHHSR